ncbi:hypothetical protein JW859_01355 [bacterium]|nr:hypothetical protein [bacterium]
MWQCPECQFWNDEPDDNCVRCRHKRGAQPSGVQGAQPVAAAQLEPKAQPQPTAPPQPLRTVKPAVDPPDQPVAAPDSVTKPAKQRSGLGAVEWIAIVVIAGCLLALGWLGFNAWRGEGVTLPALANLFGTAETGSLLNGAQIAQLEEDESPLATVYTAKVRNLKHFRPYADQLLATNSRLLELAEPLMERGGLTVEASAYLDALKATGDELLTSFAAYQADCDKYRSEDLEAYLSLIRFEYLRQFDDVLNRVAAVYARDTVGEHAAYDLSEAIPAALGADSSDHPELYLLTWSEAVAARQELLLNIEQEDEYKRLAAYANGLKDYHRSFQASLDQIPPYQIKNGRLDKSARDTLELLDTLATTIEEMVVDFEEYKAGLQLSALSDTNTTQLKKFESLAQEDHLYAFTEIYRIYARDRKLELPVYQRLKDHFAFAEQHWPEKEMTYRRIYTQYEEEWAALWVTKP